MSTTPITEGYSVHFLDEHGRPYGIKQIDGKPYVSALPYGHDIAQGHVLAHDPMHIFGYTDSVIEALGDVSELSGALIPVPASALTMEVDSTGAADIGSVVSSGNSSFGSPLTLIDSDATFQDDGVLAGQFVAHDTDMSYGIVGVVDSQTQITFETPLSGDVSFGVDDAYRIIKTDGTGIAVVETHTLDANFVEQTQFVVMNGVSAVAMSGTHIRLNNVHAMYKGSGSGAAGDITVQSVGGGVIYGKISTGMNISLQCHYTVPAGKVGFITGWLGGISSVNPNTTGRIFLMACADFEDRGLLPGVFHVHGVMSGYGTSTPRRFDFPYKIPAKCDIKISAQRTQGAAKMVASGMFELWTENE